MYVSFSPAEIFLGRKPNFSIDTLAEEAADELIDSTQASYFQKLKRRAALVRKTVFEARELHFEKMEKYDPQSKVKVRAFNIGDEVTVYAPSTSKKKNKLSALQDGPYEVAEADGTGTQYQIKMIGAGKSKPRWVHLDEIKTFRRFLGSKEDGEKIGEAKPHSKEYEVLRIVEERGKTRRTKYSRVQWKGVHDTTWEPATNLDHCKQASRDWTLLKPEQQEALLASINEALAKWKEEAEEEVVAIVQVGSPRQASPTKIASVVKVQEGAVTGKSTRTNGSNTQERTVRLSHHKDMRNRRSRTGKSQGMQSRQVHHARHSHWQTHQTYHEEIITETTQTETNHQGQRHPVSQRKIG